MQDEEVELVESEEIAPWLVKPESNKFYKVWVVFITLSLQVELMYIPLILVGKQTLQACDKLSWALDVIWMMNMLIKLQTIRPDNPSKNPFQVAISYIKSEFAIDLLATMPSIVSR